MLTVHSGSDILIYAVAAGKPWERQIAHWKLNSNTTLKFFQEEAEEREEISEKR